MPDTALTIQGLSKTYRIPRRRAHNRITEAAVERLRHPLRRTAYDEFEAIDDITLDIDRGEAVGILGRNGAGKSTLLKLITRITAPTRGSISLGGRVGSLLEVGTGFNGELTGRENVFLSGSIMGMKRREILRRFDEIVDFSGVETFIDTPVKRYSSGMYVRLAFAVAAHLDTELMVIDEVLAVGDAKFQQKAIAKMRSAATDGRTVLYVSHQPDTVTALCSSAVFLERGRLLFQGGVAEALHQYRSSYESFRDWSSDAANRPGTGEVRFTRVRVLEETVDPTDVKVIEFETGEGSGISDDYWVACHVNDERGNVVLQCDSRLSGQWFDPHKSHLGQLRIKGPWLQPGHYTVDMYVVNNHLVDTWEGAGSFEVLAHYPYPEMAGADATAKGVVLSDFSYEVER